MAENDNILLEPIARICTQFPDKFGVPRQSGLVESLEGTIVFEEAYRDADALRGIEGFSHLWLIWGFNRNARSKQDWTPLVRPPRLGGNEKRGVFATRSPFRPNGLGLSAVELVGVEEMAGQGSVLKVHGADLVDGTPIYDIKPYVPYADCLPHARGGFAEERDAGLLEVEFPEELAALMGQEAQALRDVLARDPRPAFHDDPQRIYGFTFSSWKVKFRASEGVCTVLEVSIC